MLTFPMTAIRLLSSQGCTYKTELICYPTYFALKVDVLFCASPHLTRWAWFSIIISEHKSEGHCSTSLIIIETLPHTMPVARHQNILFKHVSVFIYRLGLQAVDDTFVNLQFLYHIST